MEAPFLGQRDPVLRRGDGQPLQQAYTIRDEIQELNQTTAMMEQGTVVAWTFGVSVLRIGVSPGRIQWRSAGGC